MKKIFICLILLSFAALTCLSAQDDQQNPNAAKAAQQYQTSLDDHEATMGGTIQNTYEARDPRQEKKDDRIQRREDRRDFNRQLRLERARRPIITTQRRRRFNNNNWRNTYPFGYNF